MPSVLEKLQKLPRDNFAKFKEKFSDEFLKDDTIFFVKDEDEAKHQDCIHAFVRHVKILAEDNNVTVDFPKYVIENVCNLTTKKRVKKANGDKHVVLSVEEQAEFFAEIIKLYAKKIDDVGKKKVILDTVISKMQEHFKKDDSYPNASRDLYRKQVAEIILQAADVLLLQKLPVQAIKLCQLAKGIYKLAGASNFNKATALLKMAQCYEMNGNLSKDELSRNKAISAAKVSYIKAISAIATLNNSEDYQIESWILAGAENFKITEKNGLIVPFVENQQDRQFQIEAWLGLLVCYVRHDFNKFYHDIKTHYEIKLKPLLEKSTSPNKNAAIYLHYMAKLLVKYHSQNSQSLQSTKENILNLARNCCQFGVNFLDKNEYVLHDKIKSLEANILLQLNQKQTAVFVKDGSLFALLNKGDLDAVCQTLPKFCKDLERGTFFDLAKKYKTLHFFLSPLEKEDAGLVEAKLTGFLKSLDKTLSRRESSITQIFLKEITRYLRVCQQLIRVVLDIYASPSSLEGIEQTARIKDYGENFQIKYKSKWYARLGKVHQEMLKAMLERLMKVNQFARTLSYAAGVVSIASLDKQLKAIQNALEARSPDKDKKGFSLTKK